MFYLPPNIVVNVPVDGGIPIIIPISDGDNPNDFTCKESKIPERGHAWKKESCRWLPIWASGLSLWLEFDVSLLKAQRELWISVNPTAFLWNRDISPWAPHLYLAVLCVFQWIDVCLNPQEIHRFYRKSAFLCLNFQWIQTLRSIDFLEMCRCLMDFVNPKYMSFRPVIKYGLSLKTNQ